jgi:hypothetical protein
MQIRVSISTDDLKADLHYHYMIDKLQYEEIAIRKPHPFSTDPYDYVRYQEVARKRERLIELISKNIAHALASATEESTN